MLWGNPDKCHVFFFQGHPLDAMGISLHLPCFLFFRCTRWMPLGNAFLFSGGRGGRYEVIIRFFGEPPVDPMRASLYVQCFLFVPCTRWMLRGHPCRYHDSLIREYTVDALGTSLDVSCITLCFFGARC